ncbi:hypothetical protein BGZ81_008961 [Podila clonocystis]|nr:hypothetical protein BGZ81_008961 [Podila clonocystis]
MRHQNTENQGCPRSRPSNGGNIIPSFSTAFGNAIREYESRRQYPSQNSTLNQYSQQNSAKVLPGYALEEGPSGSQGHRLYMDDAESSMVRDCGIGPSERLSRNDDYSSITYLGQSNEYGPSNSAGPSNDDMSMDYDTDTNASDLHPNTSNYVGSYANRTSSYARPLNGDVVMDSDAWIRSDPTRDAKRRKANDNTNTNAIAKGKGKAADVPKNYKGKIRTDAGLTENVNMEIIRETGRVDSTQERRKPGRPRGSKNKPKPKPSKSPEAMEAQPSEFNEAEATSPKKKVKPLKPEEKRKKASRSKEKSVKVSKPKDGSKHRSNKRALEPEIEDEADQIEDQDDKVTVPEKTPPPSNLGGPSTCEPPGGPDGSPPGSPPDSPSNPGGPGGPGGSGGPPGSPGDSANNSSGPSGPPPGPPSNPGNPGEPGPPSGPANADNDPPQDYGYRYGGKGTASGADTTPPGSPIPPYAPLLSELPTVQHRLQEFMNFMRGHATNAVFSPWRGFVYFDCRNNLQFQQLCNIFSTTFCGPGHAPVMSLLPGHKFELQIKFTFHWTQDHVDKLSRVLQDVRTLERLDLWLCTAAEINASRRDSPTKTSKVTRTTCCTSHLMKLISENPHIHEVRLRGVSTFFIREFTHVPDMRHLKVLEMDVDAWEPPTEPEGRNTVSEMYCRRYERVLDRLSGLEMLVLHCSRAPGAFERHLEKMRRMMYTLAHAKNVQPRSPQIQRGGFLIRLKARHSASVFEIGRLDADGNMTDVHAVFTDSDHANLENWITDSRVPETSTFRGLFKHSTLWSHVERLTTTGRLPVWCMNALETRRNQDEMTQLHGMALQDITIENGWWGHFLDFLARLHFQIFVMRDCAFPGNMLGATEASTDWIRLFNAVGQRGQVTGLGLVNTQFGDAGELLLRELWSLVDAREIQVEDIQGQMAPMALPRWNALRWVNISGSVDTTELGWGAYEPFLFSQEVRHFGGVRVIDPDHFIF